MKLRELPSYTHESVFALFLHTSRHPVTSQHRGYSSCLMENEILLKSEEIDKQLAI
jgi:hypothetical protein